MKKIIHHLRKRPEEEKKHILHITTIAFAVVLILLWVYSLGVTITDKDTQEKVKQDLKPFSALKDNLVGGYNSISNTDTEVLR